MTYSRAPCTSTATRIRQSQFYHNTQSNAGARQMLINPEVNTLAGVEHAASSKTIVHEP